MIFKVHTHDPTLPLKLVTCIIGLVDVVLGAVGTCGRGDDIYFLIIVLVVFCLSLMQLMCTIFDIVKTNGTSRRMDFVFNLVAAISILVVSIIMLCVSSNYYCAKEKTSAATIGILNSLIYLYIACLVLRLLRQKDSGSLLPMYILCACSKNPLDLMKADPRLQKKHSNAGKIEKDADFVASVI